MKEEEIEIYFERLKMLNLDNSPQFGKMNANQMVCHCADQIRLALGTFKAEEYGKLSPKEVMAISRSGKTVPTAKGLGQIEGGGTKPINFKTDVKILKEHILYFSAIEKDFKFGLHPYFGEMSKEKWVRLTSYHLNYHLTQFGV